MYKRQPEARVKVNIAVISNDISSLFKLIAYRLNKTLADFINLVKLFDAKSLDAEELKKFDVILNATEMNLRFDKPTLKIQPSLSENDLHILRLLLNNLNEKFHLDKLIRPELYLEISASSRQEALMKQIEHIRKSLDVYKRQAFIIIHKQPPSIPRISMLLLYIVLQGITRHYLSILHAL